MYRTFGWNSCDEKHEEGALGDSVVLHLAHLVSRPHDLRHSHQLLARRLPTNRLEGLLPRPTNHQTSRRVMGVVTH